MIRRAQPTTSDETSGHHSTSRTALTILTTKLSTTTPARHPHDPHKHGTIWRMARRQTRTRAPHHRAGTAPWGSHGEHRDATRETDGALPPAGGVNTNGTGDTGRRATEHREIPDDWLCMQHCQGGAGTRAPNLEKTFYSGPTTTEYFSPPGGADGAQEKPTVPAPRTWHQPTRNKQNTCTQQIDCASTHCNDKEPTPNEPTKRRLTRPHTNKTATATTT